ncbi:MAG: alpha-amylase [Verrucomicrobiaceae bacterium]|nr:alpha-amylase [Verrucomicrobiaceae bacterium]
MHSKRISLWQVALLALSLGEAAQAVEWHLDAIWYQIFPERFSNGDIANDPVPASMKDTWPFVIPTAWQVSPWTSDWYQLQPWEQDEHDFYHHAQLRRYGGDLQGILDKLDYLKDLGVNALYLNPVFESPSLHKYGAACYHHVDKHYGPDPTGDLAIVATEDPADPATWKWTAADKLFLTLIEEVHRREMKIIIDGVFNHVGIPFWAFQRAKREGPKGRFAKWFRIDSWDDPATPEDEFVYHGWANVKGLPELRKDQNGPCTDAKEHMHHVVRRWMDPNGDGDPSDGIDGWRLDVAAEVPIGFWKEFRGWVKMINPDAYLAGEIWWEDYQNHELANAAPWLGVAFDGVMNYRFADAAFAFFHEPGTHGDGALFAKSLSKIHTDYGYDRSMVLQNLLDSHDVARVASVVMNPAARLDHSASVKHQPDYHISSPDAAGWRRLKQLAAFQFVLPGAPFVYYGTEAGMWGADDPDCRKPMVWPDLTYDSETAHPGGREVETSEVKFDLELHAFYRKLTQLRQKNPIWRRGSFKIVGKGEGWIAFERGYDGKRAVVVANATDAVLEISREMIGFGNGGWERHALVGGTTSIRDLNTTTFEVGVREVEILSP